MSDDLIRRQELYEKTAEWEAQAIHMVKKTMNDEDPTEWKKWSAILAERSAFKFDVADAPTVDAVPVVHGEWTIDGMNEYELSYGCIGYEPRYRCSRCGITTESYLRTEKPIMPEDADFPYYCPNCGAKMDGERKDGERDGRTY